MPPASWPTACIFCDWRASPAFHLGDVEEVEDEPGLLGAGHEQRDDAVVGEPHLDRAGDVLARRGGAHARLGLGAVLVGDEVEHGDAQERRAGGRAEALQQMVAFGDVARLIHQRDADGRVLEQMLEAALGDAQRPLPAALRGEVAQHRARAQAGAVGVGDHGLGDEGLERAPLAAAERHLAVALAGLLEGVVRRGDAPRCGDDEIAQPEIAPQDFLGREAEPVGKRLVDEQEAAVLVHGVEADGGVFQEIEEGLVLLADDLFQLPLGGHVLDAPDHMAGAPGDGTGDELVPFRFGGAERHLDFAAGDDAAPGGGLQALEFLLRAAGAREIGGERLERRAVFAIEYLAEERVDVNDGALVVHHQARGGKRAERFGQEPVGGFGPPRPGHDAAHGGHGDAKEKEKRPGAGGENAEIPGRVNARLEAQPGVGQQDAQPRRDRGTSQTQHNEGAALARAAPLCRHRFGGCRNGGVRHEAFRFSQALFTTIRTAASAPHAGGTERT
jgi:hypothetical protein